jgi:maltose O-acetyltransferase
MKYDLLLYVCNYFVAVMPSSRLRHLFYRYVMKIRLHSAAHILGGLWVDSRSNLCIGKNSVVNQGCRLDNRGGIEIGENVSISSYVHIYTADHDVYSPVFAGRLRSVRIEDYVFVGSRATILPGVTLGKGCAVGASSVVTKDVPPGSVVVGNPARPVAERPCQLSYELSYRRHFI